MVTILNFLHHVSWIAIKTKTALIWTDGNFKGFYHRAMTLEGKWVEMVLALSVIMIHFFVHLKQIFCKSLSVLQVATAVPRWRYKTNKSFVCSSDFKYSMFLFSWQAISRIHVNNGCPRQKNKSTGKQWWEIVWHFTSAKTKNEVRVDDDFSTWDCVFVCCLPQTVNIDFFQPWRQSFPDLNHDVNLTILPTS